MKKTIIMALSCIALLNVAAFFQSFNYVSPGDFKKWLETDKAMIIVDIQDKSAFAVSVHQHLIFAHFDLLT